MKTISNILLVAFGLCSGVLAQGVPPKPGFIRLVQAMAPGTGKVNVRIDGDDIFPKGYDLSQCSGGMGFHGGEHRIDVVKQGVEPATVKIPLAEGETITLVVYAEKLPAVSGDDGKPKWKARLLRLRQPPPEPGYHLTLASVSGREEIPVRTLVAGRNKPVISLVRRLSTVGVHLGRGSGDTLELESGDHPLGRVSLDEKGSYVVILYDKEDGGVGMVSFFDPKFVIAG
jgi:hypothetical protein